MIDLHCHLCFGCDDGPPDAAESRQLAMRLVDAGVTTVACTQHLRPDKGWMNTLDKQAWLHASLDEALQGIPLRRVSAGEHYVDDEVFGRPLAGRAVPYGASRWLLVEIPYPGPPPDLFGLLYNIRRQGYRVLLAHLERFPYVADRPDLVQRLVDAGHLIQVNLGSLAGSYTRAHQRTAERLVLDGFASVAAGDCHRAHDVDTFLLKGLKALKKLAGDDVVKRLTVTNPQAILDDAQPDRIWP